MPEKIDSYRSYGKKGISLFAKLLFTGRSYSLSELATHFACSKQTILRLIKVRTTIHRVKAPEASGLVHAKLYFFHWQNKTSAKNLRKFYLGSPNASLQGFGVHSEVLAEINFKALSPEMRKLASGYFKSLSSGESEGIALTTSSDGVRIWLPEIYRALPGAPSFDSWVRAGRLCHRYSPDTGFGKLIVKLRKPLSKTDDEEVFARQGFVRETRREMLQRAYAGAIEPTDDTPQWRSKYFVETDYGDWTSNDCFVAQQDGALKTNGRSVIFQALGAQDRSAILNKIRDAEDAEHNEWIADFGDALAKVAEQMKDRGLKPEEYLYFKSGHLDLLKYKQKWQNKLQSDRARARIPEFYKRMESGFAFPLVPPLGPNYEEFIHGLCTTLLRGARLLRRRNYLAKTIGNVLGTEQLSEIEDGAEMYETLLEVWKDHKSRLRIMQFHLDEADDDE